jgi:hypothetical protein
VIVVIKYKCESCKYVSEYQNSIRICEICGTDICTVCEYRTWSVNSEIAKDVCKKCHDDNTLI